jgi:amino acid transporter
MLTAFFVVTFLYFMSVSVTVGVLGDGLIKASGQPSLTPISDGAHVSMGSWGQIALAVGAILAFVSTGNAGILAASRNPMAMSRDNLLPKFFESVHKKFQTPYLSILSTTGLMVTAILFLDLEMLVKTASTINLLLFTSVNIALLIMRESGIPNYRPKFKSPLYPWLQIAGIIGGGFLLVEMGIVPLLISSLFLGLSLLWYWLYGRIRSNRQSALIHLVRRLTPKELTTYSLNEELRGILLERDEIVEDRFDVLVQRAEVLELEDSPEMEEAFKMLAEILSKKVNLPSEQVYDLLIKRERDSSTVVAPGLAIPHIILPGEKRFEILLVRCKDGIIFSTEPVNAMFVLAGTYDERNFHLNALMSIAQVVRKPDFMKKWLRAANKSELKDIVLLREIE